MSKTKINILEDKWLINNELTYKGKSFKGKSIEGLLFNSRMVNAIFDDDLYIKEVVNKIKSKGMEVKAPYLNAGDVLFWNSKTVHGSLDSQSKYNSRSSITLHAIPRNRKLLQFQSRIRNLDFDDLGNSLIHRPKDQSKFVNKLIFFFESNFPFFFYLTKNIAIKSLFKKKN